MSRIEKWFLKDRNTLISYMKSKEIVLDCRQKERMMKPGSEVGPGLSVSFVLKKALEEYWWGSPPAIFSGATKRKVKKLLGLTVDSTVEDCKRINEEVGVYEKKELV